MLLLAAVFLLFSAASCDLNDACANLRDSSRELNRIARTASRQTRNGTKDVSKILNAPPWVETKDMCDPGNLRETPETCMDKLFHTIRNYTSVLNMLDGDERCLDFRMKAMDVLQSLNGNMTNCVKSVGADSPPLSLEKREERRNPTLSQENDTLCKYTMDRLFSFSVLAARVFALGNPKGHAAGSAQGC